MAASLFLIPKTVALQAGVVSSGAKANFYITGTTTRQNTYSDVALSVAHANPVVADGNGVFPAIFLDDTLNYKVDITDSSDVSLTGYPVDNLASIATPTAASITVADAGAYFADSDAESIFQDIGANYTRGDRAEDISASWSMSGSGSLIMNDKLLIGAQLRDYSLDHEPATSSSNVTTLSMGDANSFFSLLTENTTIAITNASPVNTLCQLHIEFEQDSAGGAYTVSWPASVLWPGGVAPVISTGNGAIDTVTLTTRNGGTTWLGNYSQAYA